MLGRALKNGIADNPLVDSPYFQQYDIGFATAPPIESDFLLLDSTNFLLLDGTNLLLLGS